MKTTIIIDISDSANYEKKNWPVDGLLIFSDEWADRNKQCLNFLNAKNHIYNKKIYARKCKVKEISQIIARDFLEQEHVQGSNYLGIVYFGIYHQEDLLGVMSLGRHSRQIAENRIVLDRFCVKSSTHLPGGATKLFKNAIEWASRHKYDEIISFSDNRWTNGDIYKILGFSLEKEHKPDYSYVDTTNQFKRLSKQSQKKSSTKCPQGMTELDWAKQRGLKRIWDRGKKRWTYMLDKSCPTWKELLSKKCADQHASCSFKHSHMRGYFKSTKNNCEIYYGSSYELRCIFLLESDSLIKSFSRAESFKDSQSKWRNPDLNIEYMDGTKELREIKQNGRLPEVEVIKQIEETKKYAESNGYIFKLWTESDSLLKDERAIIKWAKFHIAETTGNTDWIQRQKFNDNKKAKKYYDKHIATDTVKIFCDYCKTYHFPLRITAEPNIARNGIYICEAHGGHIVGSKPKPYLRKENPYAALGEKQCVKCERILSFENFSPDKSRRDGYSSRCKECRASFYKDKYRNKT